MDKANTELTKNEAKKKKHYTDPWWWAALHVII